MPISPVMSKEQAEEVVRVVNRFLSYGYKAIRLELKRLKANIFSRPRIYMVHFDKIMGLIFA